MTMIQTTRKRKRERLTCVGIEELGGSMTKRDVQMSASRAIFVISTWPY